MKKTLLSLSIIAGLLSTPLFASKATSTNKCLKNIESRVFTSYLNLSFCRLTDQDMPAVVSFLNAHPELTDLFVDGNNIGPAGALTLSKITTVQQLFISDNYVGDKGAIALAKNSAISTLFIQRNHIGPKGFTALAHDSALNYLFVGGETDLLDKRNLKAIAEASNLQNVGLEDSGIDDEGAIILAKSTSIQYLDLANDHLYGNYISAVGLAALASNKTLQSLQLSKNNINDAGAYALAGARANLHEIWLDSNNISSQGAKVLASNKNFKFMQLSDNPISEEGVLALAGDENLDILELDHVVIDSKAAAAFAKNKNMSELALAGDQIDDEKAITLSSMPAIQELVLPKNNIHNEGAKALANLTLVLLDVSYNHIGSEGLTALRNSKTINYLYMDDNDDNVQQVASMKNSILQKIKCTRDFHNPLCAKFAKYK